MKTLFPPIVHSSLPAFDKTKPLRFYYKPSTANTISQAKHIQVSITFVETNRSSLSSAWSTFEILFADVNTSNIKDGWYYIDIPTSEFPISDKGYKIQVRLAEMVKPITVSKEWLNSSANLNQFSEWSTVCTVMPITVPTIGIQGMNIQSTTALTSGRYNFIGNYSGIEPLQKYEFDVYSYTNYADKNTWSLLESSGEKRIGLYERPTLTYNPKTNFNPSENYVVVLTCLTKNRYLSVQEFKFTVSIPSITTISQIIATPIYSRGQIEVALDSGSLPSGTENLIVKRTSIASNFEVWEHVQTIDRPTSMTRFIFMDSAVEQGLVYQYGVQTELNTGARSAFKLSQRIIADYEDVFLVGENGKQLRLRFDCKINNVRKNMREARVETLGSQFPFIIKNSKVGYREFNLSGLLTHFMDTAAQFYTEDMLINEEYREGTFPISIYNMYKDYNAANGINRYNDTLTERKFKEDVLRFLQDGKPKLLKSPTEGLILVRLLEINYNPTEVLRGLTANLSMTCVEIGEVNDENLFKYLITE